MTKRWAHELITMAREVAERLLNGITVFCVSEPNDHQTSMWAHYAAGHTGFCAGYVCPVGILNPAHHSQGQLRGVATQDHSAGSSWMIPEAFIAT